MEYIYILRSYGKSASHIKVGYTSEIWDRMRAYKSCNPHIEVVYIAKIDNAFEIEQKFHSEHKSTFGNEWYEEDYLEIIMNYLNEKEHEDVTNINKAERVYKPKYKVIGETYKLLLKEYCDIVEGKNSELTEEYILSIIPEAKLIVDTLGTSKIRTSNYIKKDLTSLVYSNSDEFKTAVKHAILTKFQYGKVYPSSYVKQEIQAIYKNLHAIKKAKATDLNEYFEISKKKRLINGKTTDSIEIIKQK